MTGNRFVSHAQFTVVVEKSSALDSSSGLLSLVGDSSSANSDTKAVIGYINSADLLLKLEKEFNLIEHYSSPEYDYYYRLPTDAPKEYRLKYYRERIVAEYSLANGVVDLKVDTYSSDLSFLVSKRILDLSRIFANSLKNSIAKEQLEFINNELDRAESKIKQKERSLLEFQNKNQIINPQKIIQAQLESIQNLRSEKLKSQIDLSVMKVISPKSPQIKSRQQILTELENEIASQVALLAGPEHQKLNQLLLEYKNLELDIKFAVKIKAGVELLLEKTRTKAIDNALFFAVIQSPTVPDDYTKPRRAYLSITSVILLALTYYILSALYKSLKEV